VEEESKQDGEGSMEEGSDVEEEELDIIEIAETPKADRLDCESILRYDHFPTLS
jgi:hypothetical protein